MKNGLLLLLLPLESRTFSRRLVAVGCVSRREISFLSVARTEMARTERLAALCMHHSLMALRRLVARVDPLRETDKAIGNAQPRPLWQEILGVVTKETYPYGIYPIC